MFSKEGSNPRRGGLFFLCLLLAALLPSLVSCAKKPDADKPAVTINRYTLTAGEFEELYRQYGPEADTAQNRDDFLNNLVTRKILLQEAQRRQLDTQKVFLRSVESFWEQSLLRLVVDQKMKETTDVVTVTDQEIDAYYKRWILEDPDLGKTPAEAHDLVLWRIRQEKEALRMKQWIDDLVRGANVHIDRKAVKAE